MAAINPLVGGGGAMHFADGPDGSGGNAGTLKNTPVEINELEVPIRIVRYELEPDSGGAGRYRGGLATTFEFQLFSPNTVITSRNRDRTRFCAWGIKGGRAGAPSRYVVNPEGPGRLRELGNTDIVTVGPGDIVRITSSGGGGWGVPLDRPPGEVARDVAWGFVSVAAARDVYGVVLRDGAVDGEATERCRAEMPRSGAGHFDYGAERTAFERQLPPASYDRLVDLLQTVPVTWRFYLKHQVFERLEAEMTPEGIEHLFGSVKAAFPQLR
jgi:N-methylhydantoinase B